MFYFVTIINIVIITGFFSILCSKVGAEFVIKKFEKVRENESRDVCLPTLLWRNLPVVLFVYTRKDVLEAK